MADGAFQHPFHNPTLGEAAAFGRLQARCVCGAEASIDPGPWLSERLSSRRLSTLAERLRCACGARQVALAAGALEGVSETGAIFIFR